jgi:hypothetical protein
MQATAIGHARQALAGCPFPVSLEVGDLRDCVLPEADVITLFDVLHYLPRQPRIRLRRIRNSLPADGRLLLRVGDGAAGLPHHLSRIVDSLVVRAQAAAGRACTAARWPPGRPCSANWASHHPARWPEPALPTFCSTPGRSDASVMTRDGSVCGPLW